MWVAKSLSGIQNDSNGCHYYIHIFMASTHGIIKGILCTHHSNKILKLSQRNYILSHKV